MYIDKAGTLTDEERTKTDKICNTRISLPTEQSQHTQHCQRSLVMSSIRAKHRLMPSGCRSEWYKYEWERVLFLMKMNKLWASYHSRHAPYLTWNVSDRHTRLFYIIYLITGFGGIDFARAEDANHLLANTCCFLSVAVGGAWMTWAPAGRGCNYTSVPDSSQVCILLFVCVHSFIHSFIFRKYILQEFYQCVNIFYIILYFIQFKGKKRNVLSFKISF